MRIYELFDEMTENFESVAPESFSEVCETDTERIKKSVREKLGLRKKKRHFRRAIFALAAAVAVTGTVIAGAVIVTGQTDTEYYRDNGYGEYISIYRELCQEFTEEGVPELDESSPFYDSRLKNRPVYLAQEMAKQEMINRIYEAAKPYSEAISDNDPNTYYNDRAAYYEFITEICRLYKGNELSDDDKGRILWLIIFDYYTVESHRRTLRGDEYYNGLYNVPVDLVSIKPQREEACNAVEEIITGLRNKNLIPAPEKRPSMDDTVGQMTTVLKEKTEKIEAELKMLVEQGIDEYQGMTGINADNYKEYAEKVAKREIRLETFEMVKEQGLAKDMDESVVDVPDKEDAKAWIKHLEYLADCHDLYYNSELSGYERYCLNVALQNLPDSLPDKEANKLLKKTKMMAEEIRTAWYMDYISRYNEWRAAQDPSLFEDYPLTSE